MIYPYRSAVIAVEVIAAEDDFERAAAADQMCEAFRTAAGMHSHSDFRLAQSRGFARREAHVTGQDEFAAHATEAVSDLRDADHRRLGEPDERIHGDGSPKQGTVHFAVGANRQPTFRVAAI